MEHGGKRRGAGRPKGAVASKSRMAAELIAASGLTPLEYMVGVLRGTTEFDPVRFEAAKHAAPYVHARLAAVEHSGETKVTYDVASDPISPEQWAQQHATAH